MGRSVNRQGIINTYDEQRRRMKQYPAWDPELQERFSLGEYPDEKSAWEADDREEIRFEDWPNGLPKR